MHISGSSYEDNDHVALESDLATVARLGLKVVPLAAVVDALLEDNLAALGGTVALTFDDGSDFDYHDMLHPSCGPQRGMFNILRDAAIAQETAIEATTFVIVSPDARRELDRNLMIGKGWWNDEWWAAADASGVMRVESHSWDHNHDHLAATVASAPRGAFDLATFEDADAEIRMASEYLRRRRGRAGPVMFAYPYGPASDYLADEYFPSHPESGVVAAFTTEGAPVSHGADRWRLPRYVCGWHWKSPAQLEAILKESL